MKQWETMGVQLSECDQVNVAKWKQPGEYNQVYPTRWMQQLNATKWMLHCNQVNVTKEMQPRECKEMNTI